MASKSDHTKSEAISSVNAFEPGISPLSRKYARIMRERIVTISMGIWNIDGVKSIGTTV